MMAAISELVGKALVGVVLFGSMARGESREGSDMDLLIVLRQSLSLTRRLYARWDQRFAPEEGSPHFVHLPLAAMDAGSLWFEAAVDGIVLHDVDDETARFLGSLRRLIASGKVRRLSAYGHPNWVKSEDEAPLLNDALAADDLKRSGHRLKALEVLLQEQSWADVVRESQELVEITLKALLRACRIEVPRIHDVSPLLEENRERLPAGIREQVPELVRISRTLRRDRELAFYGSEDLTPSEFYHRDDAESAFASARFVHAEVLQAMEPHAGPTP